MFIAIYILNEIFGNTKRAVPKYVQLPHQQFKHRFRPLSLFCGYLHLFLELFCVLCIQPAEGFYCKDQNAFAFIPKIPVATFGHAPQIQINFYTHNLFLYTFSSHALISGVFHFTIYSTNFLQTNRNSFRMNTQIYTKDA